MSVRSFFFSALAFGIALAGCSGSTHLPQTGGIVLDTPKSVSPASVAPAPMAHTAILPASVMAVKPQSTILDPTWTQLPGAGIFAAADPYGTLWVLSSQPSGPDKYIWHYANGAWTNISGLASRLAVSPADGTLYALNSGGGTYHYSNGVWTALGGGATDISVAVDGSFYVLSNGNSAGSDQAIWHFANGFWNQVPGSGVKIAAPLDIQSYTLSSGAISGFGLYILNSIGSIYYENSNNSFVQLPGSASAVAPTTNGGVFVLGYPSSSSGNSPYYFDLSAPGWTLLSGLGVSISADSTHLYAIGSTGAIYVSPITRTTGTIAEYSLPTTTWADHSVSSPRAESLAAGPDGNLWFTEGERYASTCSNHIGKITTGGAVTEYLLPNVNADPCVIATGSDGNLWFAEFNQNKIGKISTGGTGVSEYPIPTANACSCFIAGGPDGNVWFTETNSNKIGRITTSGTITEFVIPTANALPGGLVAGPDGNVWFTEESSRKIGKITPSGTISEYPLPSTSTGTPLEITAGPDGNLWFTENVLYYYSNIGKITTAGAITEYGVPTANAQPFGIAAGADGNLWFAENGSNKVGRITTSGSFAEYPLPNGDSQPREITAGTDGKVWFTEWNANVGDAFRIGKITP
jgi:streptogramin lyase